MYRNAPAILLDDARRGDDRRQADKPPVLKRRTINILALLGVGVIFYGTLLPFNPDPGRELTWQLDWHRPAAGDTVANILLYIPVGAFLRLFFRRRGSSVLRECVLAALTIGGLAYGTEVLQSVIPSRVPSMTDAACNVFGACMGILAAPLIQRMLRNLHAWLFTTLRRRPFTAAAAIATVCIWIYGVAPFDPKPTATQLSQALDQVRNGSLVYGYDDFVKTGGFSHGLLMDKLLDAGAYALLAMLLVAARREKNQKPWAAGRDAVSRAVAMAAGIEMIQLFTMSHTASAADLTAGWFAAMLGGAFAATAAAIRPQIHRQPLTLFRWFVACGSLLLMVYEVLILPVGGSSVWSQTSWLPMASNFNRSWNGLLGVYAMAFLQSAMLAGMLTLWARASRREPWPMIVVLGPALVAATLGFISALAGHALDTALVAIALVAGLGVLRIDRALAGGRGAVAVQPAG